MTTDPRPDFPLFRALVAFALAALLVPMVISISGCTAIGYGIGHAIDHDKVGRVLPAADALAVLPGAAILLELPEGKKLEGIYTGRGRVNEDAYRAAWDSWRATHGGPALGDTVQLERESGGITVVFRGFVFRALDVQTLDGAQSGQMAFRSFRVMRSRDWSLSADSLEHMNADGTLPTREALRIATGTRRQLEEARWGDRGLEAPRALPETVLVAFEDVRHVLAPARQTATAIGVAVGLAADALVITTLAALATYDPYAGCDMSQVHYTVSASPFVTPLQHDWDLLAGREVGAPEGDAVAVTDIGTRP